MNPKSPEKSLVQNEEEHHDKTETQNIWQRAKTTFGGLWKRTSEMYEGVRDGSLDGLGKVTDALSVDGIAGGAEKLYRSADHVLDVMTEVTSKRFGKWEDWIAAKAKRMGEITKNTTLLAGMVAAGVADRSAVSLEQVKSQIVNQYQEIAGFGTAAIAVAEYKRQGFVDFFHRFKNNLKLGILHAKLEKATRDKDAAAERVRKIRAKMALLDTLSVVPPAGEKSESAIAA